MYQGTRWVILKQKKRSRKSHAWAPLICFWTISWWTWRQFLGGHSKRGVWLLGVFFFPPHTYVKVWKDFLPLAKPKKGVGKRNNKSFGVQEGAVMTSGEYLQRGVRQNLRVVHKAQRKVRPNWLGPSKEKNKKEIPSISHSLFGKILSGFSWNSPCTCWES